MTISLVEENDAILQASYSSAENEGVGLRDSDIERAIADAESILGEPLEKKRGRKPKGEGFGQGPTAPEIPGFDSAQFAETLSGIYWSVISAAARVPVIPTPEQAEKITPLITYCANKYIPKGASEHIPLIALCMTTIEIARQARAEVLETGKDGKRK